MRSRNLQLSAVFALSTHIWATAVMAQTDTGSSTPTPQAGNGSSGSIEEVTVTARKREESIKDVPIAVTAVTADNLRQQQIYQVRDVAQMSPGLNITTDSPARAFISMRGIGDTLINSVQPGVGIFIDGIYQPNTAYLNSPLVDVARVEVLRGPQGTLFGNNTLGGAINVITREPDNTWTGRVDGASAGSDNFRSLSGSISGPIVQDILQFRVGAAYHSQDGFMKDALIGGDANPLTQHSVNGAIKFTPTDWARFTINANEDRVFGGNTPYVFASGPTDYTLNPTENAHRFVWLSYTGASIKSDFDVSSWDTQITVIGAYNRLLTTSSGDGDYGPIDFLRSSNLSTQKTYTGEVRFDTKWNSSISTLIGLFADSSSTDDSGLTTVVASSTNLPSSGTSDLHNQAVFGTLFWNIDSAWDVALGLRYDRQKLNASSAGTAGAYKDNEFDPRVTVTRHWTPDVMTYASIARGSRGGGQNPPGAPNLIYRGDNVWTYELGSKFAAFNRHLSVNTDVFYNNYNHFIGPNAIAPSTLGAGFVTVNLNAGHVASYGFEGEVAWNLTDAWNLHGSLTLLHARVTNQDEFIAVAGYSLPGTRIPFLPDWNFLVGSGYRLDLSGGDDLTANVDVVGKGDRTAGSLDPNVDPLMKAYYLVNPSIAYHHNNLELALFATNVFDERYLENYFDRSYLARAGFTGNLVSSLSIPGDRRRVGIRFSVKF